jgi:hypothetical protein
MAMQLWITRFMSVVVCGLLSVVAWDKVSGDTITITAAGVTKSFPFNDGFGYPGDTITLTIQPVEKSIPYELSLLPKDVFIQKGNFFIDYSTVYPQPSDRDFYFSLTRAVAVNGISHDITQFGLLQVRAAADTLTLYGTDVATAYALPGLGTVTLKMLKAGPMTYGDLYNHSFDVNAAASFVPVPAPSSLVGLASLGLSGVSLSLLRRRKK